jgi:hypothetical protein
MICHEVWGQRKPTGQRGRKAGQIVRVSNDHCRRIEGVNGYMSSVVETLTGRMFGMGGGGEPDRK